MNMLLLMATSGPINFLGSAPNATGWAYCIYSTYAAADSNI